MISAYFTVYIRKYFYLMLCFTIVKLVIGCSQSPEEFRNDKLLSDYVDTKIGVIGTRASNTVLGPQMPFGCINPSPQSPNGTTSGFNPTKPTRGFGQLHVSGTGGASSYGHFLISPQTGVNLLQSGHDSPARYDHTGAYYLSAFLERYGITVEIAPSVHSAIYRLTFPKSDSSYLVIDASQSVPKDIIGAKGTRILENSIEIDPETGIIRGMIYTKGGWNVVSPYKFYFVGIINVNAAESGVWKNTKIYAGNTSISRAPKDELADERIGTFHRFRTDAGGQIMIKVAISLSGFDVAERNLASEIPGWDFEEVKEKGRIMWDMQLGKIRVKASTENQYKLFYTAMYHTMVMPRDFTGDNPHWKSDKPYWNDQYCIWDTWRTLFPFHLLINQDFVRDNILSFQDRLAHNDMVRDAFISGNEAGADQGGNNIDNVITDAYVKGVTGIDWNEAFKLLKFNADMERKGGGQHRIPGYDPEIYRKQGWIPYDDISTSQTLEYAYNDFCVATVAKGLNYNEDYNRYMERSKGWENLWDPDLEDKGFKGFISSRDSTGKFINLDPAVTPRPWNGPFYETNSWTYSYFVPHNIKRIIELMGGKERFVERLDFALKNDLIDHGNEPSFLALRSFSHAGRPDLTAFWVHEALEKNFDTTGGLGNDDSGAMSSWYLFSALGFFPNAGQDIYYLNPPLYEASEITLSNGKKLLITALNVSPDNIYIRSCRINGKKWNSPIFRHSDISDGGKIEFILSDKPGKWGK